VEIERKIGISFPLEGSLFTKNSMGKFHCLPLDREFNEKWVKISN
jgi:hypothetical protein